ncbi:hypothetical protein Acr_08g0018910 [Actinidia rufa]|uniref:Uncharacterized protein n=1 Tax=Actinidia rufa TaxID=165716 RepID=A0A7J0F486_9ERIC|nr:hypothetical protein Acr_08g0018910 [Actinidia rufa]
MTVSAIAISSSSSLVETPRWISSSCVRSSSPFVGSSSPFVRTRRICLSLSLLHVGTPHRTATELFGPTCCCRCHFCTSELLIGSAHRRRTSVCSSALLVGSAIAVARQICLPLYVSSTRRLKALCVEGMGWRERFLSHSINEEEYHTLHEVFLVRTSAGVPRWNQLKFWALTLQFQLFGHPDKYTQLEILLLIAGLWSYDYKIGTLQLTETQAQPKNVLFLFSVSSFGPPYLPTSGLEFPSVLFWEKVVPENPKKSRTESHSDNDDKPSKDASKVGRLRPEDEYEDAGDDEQAYDGNFYDENVEEGYGYDDDYGYDGVMI